MINSTWGLSAIYPNSNTSTNMTASAYASA